MKSRSVQSFSAVILSLQQPSPIVNDPEPRIQHLAFIRSTFDALIRSHFNHGSAGQTDPPTIGFNASNARLTRPASTFKD
jgi:hypothetical protein